MTQRLRVGVIGLGRRWARRYLPALQAQDQHFQIAAVCDQIPQRAATEAGRCRCPAAGGPAELLERDDVEAVLLLDGQWFGLWPLEQAARCGKPVFCAGSLEEDEDHADRVRQAVADARLPVLMAWGPALCPAAQHLAALVPEQFGEPRLVVGETSRRGGEGLGPRASSFLTWLLQCAGAVPTAVAAAGVGPGGWATAAFGCGERATVTLTSRPVRGRRGQLRVRVVAERGEVALVSGRQLVWEDQHGRHQLTLPRPRHSAAEQLLERFYRGLTRGEPLAPGMDEAHQALTWLRLARSATG